MLHAPRVGVNIIWDETDGMQLFRSIDFGSNFHCVSNAAGGFCSRDNADTNRAYYPAPHGKHWDCDGGKGAYACGESSVSFGGPGDMYPRMLQLADGRILLTFTKRCDPDYPPRWSATAGVPHMNISNGYKNGYPCRDDTHGTGLRALISTDPDGQKWNFETDEIILSEQDDSYHTMLGAGCQCGFGNTIQLQDNETLVTVYSYADAKELNATAPDKNGNVQGGHIGVLRWRLPPSRHAT